MSGKAWVEGARGEAGRLCKHRPVCKQVQKRRGVPACRYPLSERSEIAKSFGCGGGGRRFEEMRRGSEREWWEREWSEQL